MMTATVDDYDDHNITHSAEAASSLYLQDHADIRRIYVYSREYF